MNGLPPPQTLLQLVHRAIVYAEKEAMSGGPCELNVTPVGCTDPQALLAAWNAGEFSSNLLLSNAPWLFGSGKPERPCKRMQRAHLTSAAIFWAESGAGA
jgi:hypothetical protein